VTRPCSVSRAGRPAPGRPRRSRREGTGAPIRWRDSSSSRTPRRRATRAGWQPPAHVRPAAHQGRPRRRTGSDTVGRCIPRRGQQPAMEARSTQTEPAHLDRGPRRRQPNRDLVRRDREWPVDGDAVVAGQEERSDGDGVARAGHDDRTPEREEPLCDLEPASDNGGRVRAAGRDRRHVEAGWQHASPSLDGTTASSLAVASRAACRLEITGNERAFAFASSRVMRASPSSSGYRTSPAAPSGRAVAVIASLQLSHVVACTRLERMAWSS
jgi:hypothetical protein